MDSLSAIKETLNIDRIIERANKGELSNSDLEEVQRLIQKLKQQLLRELKEEPESPRKLSRIK